MKVKFVPMNTEYANEMIDNWKYGDKYHIYDYVNESELLLDESNWGTGKFAATDEQDCLVGELTIDFFKEEDGNSDDDGYVEHHVVRNDPEEIYEMWMGWGLRPDLCGKGLGAGFVSDCIKFAVSMYDYKGEFVRCGVAAFNERAVKVYERLGFEIFYTCTTEIAGEEFTILRMRKRLR